MDGCVHVPGCVGEVSGTHETWVCHTWWWYVVSFVSLCGFSQNKWGAVQYSATPRGPCVHIRVFYFSHLYAYHVFFTGPSDERKRGVSFSNQPLWWCIFHATSGGRNRQAGHKLDTGWWRGLISYVFLVLRLGLKLRNLH